MVQTSNQQATYGTIVASRIEEEEDGDEELLLLEDDSDYEESGSRQKKRSSNNCFKNTIIYRISNKLKSWAWWILDVDEVWDSPSVSRKRRVAVLFWFIVLAMAYAAERSTFKLLVDRVAPFRMFSAQAVTVLYSFVMAFTMIVQVLTNHRNLKLTGLGFPLADVGVMSVLDSLHLLLSFISGSKIPPIFTVLLIQMTIPITLSFAQCFRQESSVTSASRPERCAGYSCQHVSGAIVISFGLVIALFPAFMEVLNPQTPWKETDSAANMFVFALSCFPAAASTLYKEYSLAAYTFPVDQEYLNLTLAIFQVIFTATISPLVYPLQGFISGNSWLEDYPSSGMSNNLWDSLQCFTPGNSSSSSVFHTAVQQHHQQYPESADCHLSWLLILGYVIAAVLISFCADKIIHAGAQKVLYRAFSVGVILAVWIMFAYDSQLVNATTSTEDKNVMNSLHLASVIVLIIGLEIYHREPLPHSTFETEYPRPQLYMEEEY